MRSLLVLLAVLLLPATAHAATVTVNDGNTVQYAAAPGEANALTVAYAGDALSVRVTDPGAVVIPTGTCTAVDDHSAICTTNGASGQTYLQDVFAVLGDGDDTAVSTRPPGGPPIGPLNADGGPGDDVLTGSPVSDRLTGGTGADTLHGGDGGDTLIDGDPAAGADVLDAGPGAFDRVDYRGHAADVRVALDADGDDPDAGAEGEDDRLTGVEDLTGGDGDDRLTGNDEVNSLRGGPGDDALEARGGKDPDGFAEDLVGGPGDDSLVGGAGPDDLHGGSGLDTIRCGRGRDAVIQPSGRELLARPCEDLRRSFGDDGENRLELRVHPRGRVFALACPDYETLDGEPADCRGTLTLSDRRGRLVRKRFAGRGRDDFAVRVRPRRSPAGPVTVRLVGRLLPSTSWRIRL